MGRWVNTIVFKELYAARYEALCDSRPTAGGGLDPVPTLMSELRNKLDEADEVYRRAIGIDLHAEIALLGRGGLDVNDSTPTYTLTSMEGSFSGLQLVCYMYVGFKRIEPGLDAGFELSREYEKARALRTMRGQAQAE